MDAVDPRALRVLGDPTRARMLQLISESEDGRALVGRLAEVLELHEAILSYRGKGCQTAELNMSRLLCYLAMLIGDQFPKDEKPDGDLFPTTPKPVPKLEETIWWESIQRLISQAKSFVQGAPSRSQHVSRLRADAWDRLGDMCQIVHDPEIRELALKTAQNTRSTSSERQAAVALLPRFVGEDEPDEEIVNTLDELAAKPTDRSLLRAVLQAQIDLGLESELGAMCGQDDWSDAHEDD